MRPVYIYKDQNNFTRKFMADMAYLVSHKQIRLPKYYFEEGLYFLYKNSNNKNIEKYLFTKDKAGSEDENFFYFNFPFTEDQIVFQQD